MSVVSRWCVLVVVACLLGALAFPVSAKQYKFEGSLDAKDEKLDTDEYFDIHEIELKAGQLVRLTMRSEAFDTYLQINAPDEETNLWNDDISDEDYNSEIVFLVPFDGKWSIWATSTSAELTGAYEITVDVQNTKVDSTTSGELAEGDDFSWKGGEYVELYTIELAANQTLILRLHSEDFDTFLTAYAPNGRVSNDDDIDTDQSVLVVHGGESGGTVAIVVSSYDDSEEGKYTLEYRSIQE